MKPLLSLNLSLLLSLTACGGNSSSTSLKEAWNMRNDPSIMSRTYETHLSKLPQSGRITKEVWADDYWANKNGGISYRWQTREISYPFRSPEELSREEISRLSPAEKFDVLRGDPSWTLTRTERARTRVMATVPGSSDFIPGFAIASWEGLCHGWAPASILYDEPNAVTVKSPSGQEVDFKASDVSALLTYNIHAAAPIDKRLVGSRCEVGGSSTVSCRDANAASFHIILSNEIGVNRKSFIIDAVASEQVWNHPVVSYSTRYGEIQKRVTAGAAPGTVAEVEVQTDVTILVESAPHAEAHGAKNRQFEQTKHYRYVLELNASEEIIGGRWTSNDHPDFLWRQNVPSVAGILRGLDSLYKASTGKTMPVGTTGGLPGSGSSPTPTPRPDDTSGWNFGSGGSSTPAPGWDFD